MCFQTGPKIRCRTGLLCKCNFFVVRGHKTVYRRHFKKFKKMLDFLVALVYYSDSTVMLGGELMQYDSKTPIYLQVVNSIKADIVNGNLKCGDKLPSGRDLAIKYTINPNTSARVYQELELQGACFTKRGMGTYVTEDASVIQKFKKEMAQNALDDFLRSIKELGITKEEAIEMIREHG